MIFGILVYYLQMMCRVPVLLSYDLDLRAKYWLWRGIFVSDLELTYLLTRLIFSIYVHYIETYHIPVWLYMAFTFDLSVVEGCIHDL